MVRLLLSPSLLLALLPAIGNGIDLDSLLANSVGGPRAVVKIRQTSGTHVYGKVFLNGQQGQFEQVFLAPDQIRIRADFEMFTIVQAYDGETAWQQDLAGNVTEMTGHERREIVRSALLESHAYLFVDSPLVTRRYLGVSSRDGKDYHRVELVLHGTDTVTIWFDVRTGRRKFVHSRYDNLEVVSEMSDYRLVDGVLTPYYARSVVPGNVLVTEFILDSILADSTIDPGFFNMPTLRNVDFRFPSDRTAVQIPTEYENGHVRIEASINGIRKAWFILDSGASVTFLHRPTFADLDLQEAGTMPAMGVGGIEETRVLRLDSVQIDDLMIFGFLGASLDLSNLALSGKTFGGILGYDFLSRFPVMLDYANRRVTIYDPASFFPPVGGSEIPFDLTTQIPTVQASVNGVPGRFIIDLGSALGLVLHPEFLNSTGVINTIKNRDSISSHIGGIGGAVTMSTGMVETFRIGGIRIDSIRVLLPESSQGFTGSVEIAGNIGNLVLENFRLLLDYAANKAIFYPVEGK